MQRTYIPIDNTLALTNFIEQDEEDCVSYLNDIDIYKTTLTIPYPYAKKDFREWLNKQTNINFCIRLNGRPIGSCGFNSIDSYHLIGSLGYWIGKPFWGKGIMTRAVKKVCSVGFEDFNLEKITASTFDRNIASQKVLLNNGFIQEGYRTKHYIKDGERIDMKLFGLLKI